MDARPMLNLGLRGTLMNEQNYVPIAYRLNPASLPESQARRPAAVPRIVYRGKGTVIIAGVCFHRVYVFSPKEREQSVEPEDIEALLSTGLFVVAP